MNGAICEKIHAARTQLRARGERDTQDAVLAIVGGSKSTVNKYFAMADPDTYSGQVVVDGGVEVAAADEAFRESFAAYLQAAMRYLATCGTPGNQWAWPWLGDLARGIPRLPSRFGLPPSHPLVMELEADLESTYQAHMAIWEQMAPSVAPQFATAVVEAPPPPPPFTLDNLRRYYEDRSTSPWPRGIPTPGLPEDVYPLLGALLEETRSVMAEASRTRFRLYGDTEVMRHPAMAPERKPLREADWLYQRSCDMAQKIQGDMQRLRQRARDHGRSIA